MPKSLHHANLLIGTPAAAELYLRSLCSNLGIRLANNPDFFAFRKGTFGIDEARELKLLATRKALTPRLHSGQAGRKIFFISSAHLTLEAQNALLKTFEDPFPDTYFFLVAREESLVLPTLRSRMETVRTQSIEDPTLYLEAEQFLALPLKNRLLFAKKFADEEKSLPIFLDSILVLLRKQKKAKSLVESVYSLGYFARGSTAAPRLILEHLSLVLQ